ncbi:MAG TPA: HD domain-containing protein [Gemmatimonadales bacterium]|nr:HD domain-containing protein [Gemmatimonadales bacterium]
MATLERALQIAAEAHQGQLDKAGEPYLLHPLRVMLRVTGEPERIVALLHDVVEDSAAWTIERLRAEGFAEEVVQAVDRLTRREGEEYEALIERAAGHPLALRVKLADLEDNKALARLADPGERDRARIERYRRAHARLSGGSRPTTEKVIPPTVARSPRTETCTPGRAHAGRRNDDAFLVRCADDGDVARLRGRGAPAGRDRSGRSRVGPHSGHHGRHRDPREASAPAAATGPSSHKAGPTRDGGTGPGDPKAQCGGLHYRAGGAGIRPPRRPRPAHRG